MINVANNELLLRCSCHSTEHIAWLIHEPELDRGNNLKGEHDEWYLSVRLDHFRFWKRFRKGVRYIFAPNTVKYGMSAELVLRTKDMEKIKTFISAHTREAPATADSDSPGYG